MNKTIEVVAAVKDEFVNGTNVRKFIQPEQNGVSTRKMLRDGQLYLNYNGHLYDVRGTRLQ